MTSSFTPTITHLTHQKDLNGHIGVLHLTGGNRDQTEEHVKLDSGIRVWPASSSSASEVQNESSDSEKDPDPFKLLIIAFAKLRDLTQKILMVQASALDDQIKKTEEFTDDAGYLYEKYSSLKDDGLWDWKNDPKVPDIIKRLNDAGIKIDGKSVKDWLEDTMKTKEIDHSACEWKFDWDWRNIHANPMGLSFGCWERVHKHDAPETGIPKHKVLRLQEVVKNKALSLSNANTKLQTETTQSSNNYQAYISALTNCITAQSRMILNIVNRISVN